MGFIGIIYKEFLLLTATLFLQIGTSQNHPLKIPSSRSWKTYLHGLSHFIKNPYFCWSPLFSSSFTLQFPNRNPRNVARILTAPKEPSLTVFFQVIENSFVLWKQTKKQNKSFYSPLSLNANFTITKKRKSKNEAIRNSKSGPNSKPTVLTIK